MLLTYNSGFFPLINGILLSSRYQKQRLLSFHFDSSDFLSDFAPLIIFLLVYNVTLWPFLASLLKEAGIHFQKCEVYQWKQKRVLLIRLSSR